MSPGTNSKYNAAAAHREERTCLHGLQRRGCYATRTRNSSIFKFYYRCVSGYKHTLPAPSPSLVQLGRMHKRPAKTSTIAPRGCASLSLARTIHDLLQADPGIASGTIPLRFTIRRVYSRARSIYRRDGGRIPIVVSAGAASGWLRFLLQERQFKGDSFYFAGKDSLE